MGIIFEREFKSLFRSIKAIVGMAIIILVSGILFLVNNILSGYGAIHSLYSSMSLVVALVIPAVAASSFTREKKKGGEAFLAVLPMSRVQIVIGKFLSTLMFFIIPTSILVVYTLILSAMGYGSLMQSLIILLVFILAEASIIAICMMISAFCSRTWKATLISYAVLAVLFVLGMIAPLFGGFAESALRFLSPFRRFDPAVFDFFDISSIVFYLSATAFFLWIASRVFGRRKTVKRRGRPTAPVAIAIAVALLAANIAVYALPGSVKQMDISTAGIYSISDETKKLLSSLDEDITVYLINPSSAQEKLHSYIRRYCEQSDRITLKEIDTTKDTDFLSEHGISSTPALYSILVESGRRSRLVSSEDYFKYHHSEMGFMSPTEYESIISYYSEMYQYYSAYASTGQVSTDDLATLEEMLYSLTYETTLCLDADRAITTAVEYVLAEYVPTLYFVAGHGEKNTASSPLELNKLESVPVDASLLVINDPDEDYTAKEVEMLEAFSERGGKLLVMTDDMVNEMPNLVRLLACFGLSAEDGEISIDGSESVTATVNSESDVFVGYGITEVEIFGGSSILTSDIEDEGFEYSKLLTVDVPLASEDAEADAEDGSSKDETESKTLAIAVTKNNSNKLIWLTGADSFNRSTSDLSDEEKEDYVNAGYCIQASSGWLWSEFSSSISFPSAKVYNPTVLVATDGTATWVGVIFIFLIPLIAVGAPLLAVYARRRRSRSVKIVE